ncbi:hypothetical protein ACQ4PT_037423 [Festuca glaucescens]
MAGSPPLSASATGPPLTRRQGRPTAEAASTSRPTGELQPTVETANREVRAMNQKATTAWLVKFQEATYDLDDAVDDLQDHMKQERKPSPEGARKSILRWILSSSTVHRTEKKLNANIEKLN